MLCDRSKGQLRAKTLRVLFVPVIAAVLGCTATTHRSDESLTLVPETIFIEGGTFRMGTPLAPLPTKINFPLFSSEYHEDETPREVTVKSFHIGVTPVTARQFCQFLNSPFAKRNIDRYTFYFDGDIGEYRYSTIEMTDGIYRPRQRAHDAPANQVSWKGAAYYCEWLSKVSGETFRLPSKAEWELAARGPEGRIWPWGNDPPDSSRGYRWEYKPWDYDQQWTKVPVGSYPAGATPSGVHGLLGYTIGEWCSNKYQEDATEAHLVNSEVDLNDMQSPRSIRGVYDRELSRVGIFAAFAGDHYHAGRTWTRGKGHPLEVTMARYGFRVVKE